MEPLLFKRVGQLLMLLRNNGLPIQKPLKYGIETLIT